MTIVLLITFLLAQTAPASLEQIRADANLEHRAKVAIDFAVGSEHAAEADYTKGDMAAVTSDLKTMAAAVELAREALERTGKTASRNPGPYKSAELKTQDILVRLGDLEKRMDSEERSVLEGPRTRVQEIHDAWFDGIMSKKK